LIIGKGTTSPEKENKKKLGFRKREKLCIYNGRNGSSKAMEAAMNDRWLFTIALAGGVAFFATSVLSLSFLLVLELMKLAGGSMSPMSMLVGLNAVYMISLFLGVMAGIRFYRLWNGSK
jgi:hypothetical protein